MVNVSLKALKSFAKTHDREFRDFAEGEARDQYITSLKVRYLALKKKNDKTTKMVVEQVRSTTSENVAKINKIQEENKARISVNDRILAIERKLEVERKLSELQTKAANIIKAAFKKKLEKRAEENKHFEFSSENRSAFGGIVDNHIFLFEANTTLREIQGKFNDQDIREKDIPELPTTMLVIDDNKILKARIQQLIASKTPLNVKMRAIAVYSSNSLSDENTKHTYLKYFDNKGAFSQILASNDVPHIIREQARSLDTYIESVPSDEFIGYAGVEVCTYAIAPYGGGSYIQTPPELANSKKGLINIRNEDEEDQSCFWNSLIFLKDPEKFGKDPQRKARMFKKCMNDIVIPEGMSFQVAPLLLEYKVIEKANKINIEILKYDTKSPNIFIPWHKNENHNPDWPYVTMLLLDDGHRRHFVAAKDKVALVSKCISKDGHRRHPCNSCLNTFSSLKGLENHLALDCNRHAPAAIVMPKEGKTDELYFKNMQKQIVKELVYHSDCECFLEPMSLGQEPSEKKKTLRYAQHKVATTGFVKIKRTEKGIEQKYESFNNLPDMLMEIFRGAEEWCKIMKESCDVKSEVYKKLVMSEEDTTKHACAKKCWMCNKGFGIDIEKMCWAIKYKFTQFKKNDELEGILMSCLKNPKESIPTGYEILEPYIKKYLDLRTKVRDHDHLTGEYRGAAHNSCNLKCRNNLTNVDVFLHNGTKYDFHLLIEAIGKVCKKLPLQISVIALNTEKYLSISLRGKDFKITFKDSCQFMPSSLDSLVKDLVDSKHNFKFMKKEFGAQSAELLRKGVMPYDWFDSPQKLSNKGLPKIEDFFNKLTKEKMKPLDYEYAKQMYDRHECKNFGDYLELYMKTDIILLAEVFENFRNICLDPKYGYGLDPCHYYTAPGMAWDAALKTYGGSLDLLTCQDMLLMIEKGVRGGVAMASHKYGKANNKYMKNFDPNEKSSHLIYHDVNGLYSAAMLRKLPVRNFKWVRRANLSKYTAAYILSKTDDDDEGFTARVRLKYPKELHDLHNSYPLAPETMIVTKDMVSPYTTELHGICKQKMVDSQKLVPNLHDKDNYVIHYSALRQCLEMGMVLEEVYSVITYDQEAWMAGYIKKNNDNRAAAKASGNEFLIMFFKLMNNALFGKTCENIRGHVNMTIVCDYETLDVDESMSGDDAESEHISNTESGTCGTGEWDEDDFGIFTPTGISASEDQSELKKKANNCMSAKQKLMRRLGNSFQVEDVAIFSENMCCVKTRRRKILMNKPIYCGQAILDIAKTIMYEFHYNVMMKLYTPETCQLLFTDTDSLCYLIHTEDVYEDLKPHSKLLDCTSYPLGHPLYTPDKAYVIGAIKDESKDLILIEVVALKVKMYSQRKEGMMLKNKDKPEEGKEYRVEDKHTAKGVKIKQGRVDGDEVDPITQKKIHKPVTLDTFRSTLFDKLNVSFDQHSIRSFDHQLYSVVQRKQALNAIDTKRHTKLDGITSLAYGHWRIPALRLEEEQEIQNMLR